MGDHPIILVADDDPDMRHLYETHFKKLGYTVVTAANGEKVLAAFDERRPDLVILDARMPIINGFATCTALRQRDEGDELPILMVTALEDNASVDRAFDAGADDYITKPVHWEVLHQRVRHMLRGARAQRKLRESEAGIPGTPYLIAVQSW